MIEPILNSDMSGVRRAKHALFFTTRLFVLPALRVGIRLKVFGLEHVPKRGGALIICNHLGWFDPILL
ncbi:MAG TPA: 1-acyl-sn-glycerol-3-phosphate acyltransferase, partial [Thermomicrobiales bacterium]|nr:1-acyl-sn-glycerol-3-phosphate acyltransferase [Thermomicrobiales bacterium]